MTSYLILKLIVLPTISWAPKVVTCSVLRSRKTDIVSRRGVNNKSNHLETISRHPTTTTSIEGSQSRSQYLKADFRIMATEEIEASQSGVDEGGVGGPGAPTPLFALEVRILGLNTNFKRLT